MRVRNIILTTAISICLLELGAPLTACNHHNGRQESNETIETPVTDEQVLEVIQEANENGENPVITAVRNNDLKLAAELLALQRAEERLDRQTFEFPGYDFTRPYGIDDKEVVAWIKQDSILVLSEDLKIERCATGRLDVALLKVLIRFDEQELWRSELVEMFSYAYQCCDLEGVTFCLLLASDDPSIDLVGQVPKPLFLVDPFLSDLPVNPVNPNHFYGGNSDLGDLPFLWDARPDDNMIIKKIKSQINGIVRSSAGQIDRLHSRVDLLENRLNDSTEQVNGDREQQRLSEREQQAEIDDLKQQIAFLEAQRQQDSATYLEKIETIVAGRRENDNIRWTLLRYDNNAEGLSAFHYAIAIGDLETVEFLIANEVNCNARDSHLTALIRAVSSNQLQITAMLLANGADVNAVVTSQSAYVVSELSYNALYFAAISGTGDMVKLLISNGADIASGYVYRRGGAITTPLHMAAEAGNLEAVIALVAAGANVNAEDQINNGRTPLDYAASTLKYADNPDNLELVRYLIQNGARHDFRRQAACPVINGLLRG